MDNNQNNQNNQSNQSNQQNYQQGYHQYYGTSYQQNPYYGQQGFGYDAYDPRMIEARSKASNAQTFGIIALIGLFVGTILSIIFGILAMSSAKKSTQLLGYELPEAKTGRVMGLVSLILALVGVVLAIFAILFYIIVIVAAASAF